MNGQGDSGWTLRSQEFVADRSQEANQWRNVAAQAAMDTGRTIVPQMQAISQRAERHQMDMLAAQSEIGLREIQKQDAAQQLQWVQALHQTDMLQATKERAKLENRLLTVQVEEREESRKSKEFDREFGMSVQDVVTYGAHLWKKVYDPQTRKMRDATPEQQANAKTAWEADPRNALERSRIELNKAQADKARRTEREEFGLPAIGTTNGATPAAAPTAAPPDPYKKIADDTRWMPHLVLQRARAQGFELTLEDTKMVTANWQEFMRARVERMLAAAKTIGQNFTTEQAIEAVMAAARRIFETDPRRGLELVRGMGR